MVSLRSALVRLLVVAALAACAACATYRTQLVHGQRAFEQNDYEHTLALLRDLERDVTRLTVPEQAEYAYLRGMSDYRVGDKPDARHWLSIAKAIEENSPGVLPSDWKTRTNETLVELNAIVFADGMSGLAKSQSTDSDDEIERDAKASKERDTKGSRDAKQRGKGRKKDAHDAAAPSSSSSSPSD